MEREILNVEMAIQHMLNQPGNEAWPVSGGIFDVSLMSHWGERR